MVVLLLNSSAQMLYAFIYQVEVLRKWNPIRNEYQYIVGCGDWHDKKSGATKQQRAQLEQIIKKCSKKTTKVIVEDLSSNKKGQQAQCGPFIVDTTGGILGGLAQVCCAHNVSMENVEYRYCRVVSIGPLLHTPEIDAHTYASTRSIKMGNILAELQNMVRETKNYQNPNLVKWAEQLEVIVKENIKGLHLAKHNHWTVSEYIEKHTKVSERLNLFKTLLVFDSSLLDLKIINSILSAPEKNTILIVAGGTHITRSNRFLQKLGYERVHVSPTQFVPEYNNLDTCLQVQTENNNDCKKPPPVSLGLVEHYVHKR